MRVISQEGFCYQDIPYEHSAFYMSTSGTHIHANCNGVLYSLAEYSTVEKAEKVMQNLHKQYATGSKVFRFPREGEHGMLLWNADKE